MAKEITKETQPPPGTVLMGAVAQMLILGIDRWIPEHKTKIGAGLIGLVTLYKGTIILINPAWDVIPEPLVNAIGAFAAMLSVVGIRHAQAKNSAQ